MDSSTPGSSIKKRSSISRNRSKKAKVITNFFRKILRNRSKKAKVITNFFRRTKKKRIDVFLRSVCNDSGVCMALGNGSNQIKDYFDGFTNFEYVKSVKRIGAESNSGFVNSIEYEKDGYISYCILKSCKLDLEQDKKNVVSDNLMYEYLVGQYINKQSRIFPCFLETYGLYKYKSDDEWSQMQGYDESRNRVELLKEGLEKLDTPNLSTGCTHSKHIAILIQHVADAKTMYQYFDELAQYDKIKTFKTLELSESFLHIDDIIKVKENMEGFFKYDLFPILFQIYCPLALLKDNFTHYDLHPDNILLYSAKPDHYFECHYHLPDSTEEKPHIISFKTKFIPKIIDYGRSYFNDDSGTNSYAIHDALCNISPECDPDCGNAVGFHMLNQVDRYKNSSSKRNVSYDLKTLKLIKDELIEIQKSYKKGRFIIDYEKLNSRLHKLLWSSVKDILNNKEIYDDTKVLKRVYNVNDHVYNVNDAYELISILMQKTEEKYLNDERFLTSKKQGDLYVYCDGSKKFSYVPYVDAEQKKEEIDSIKAIIKNARIHKANRSKALSKAIQEYEDKNPLIKAEMMKKKAEDQKNLMIALRNGTLRKNKPENNAQQLAFA